MVVAGYTAKVGIMRESAGGNLAANVAIMARVKKIKMSMAEVLVYPIAQSDTNSASYRKNAGAKPLNRAIMIWFYKMYLPSMAAASDPRIDLIRQPERQAQTLASAQLKKAFEK